VFFAWGLQQDKSARRYVSSAVPVIFSEWDLDALKQRSSSELSTDPQFRSEAARMFTALATTLGKLKSAQEPQGSAGYGWGDQSPAEGTYGDYLIRTEFERGPAEIRLLLVREAGGWKIRAFNVNSPALMKQFNSAPRANNRVERAHGVRSTRNGEAPLLAAHASR
jgi:hypothetical protein